MLYSFTFRSKVPLCAVSALVLCGCGGNSGGSGPDDVPGGQNPLPPAASCATAGSGSAMVAPPELRLSLADRWEEGWLASPAVADLDGDGSKEIIVAREAMLVVWNADGSLKWRFDAGAGRIWASPVVADFRDDTRSEIAIAARDSVWMLDATGQPVSGFPVQWEDEMRSLAAGDIDGDGQLDLVAATGHSGPTDVVNAWHASGAGVSGFPPNQAGTSGCETDGRCYLAGCYDQNVAVGDFDGNGTQDMVVPHDNAYTSFHKGTGEAFDANAMFPSRKTPGVRYLHDLSQAKQGYADDESTALQAHFTNSAPAIADLDGDGVAEVVMLGSVQNAAQDNRELGVSLWALHADASRLAGWDAPFYAPDFLAGLWDPGDNIVAVTNQVTVADIDSSKPGPELLFPGFDGRIHAVTADRTELWAMTYTTDPDVLTGGVVVGDLSGDGIPEVVFNTYSTGDGKGSLFIVDAAGNTLHKLGLPRRGAMPVPTLADVNADGSVEIIVSLKDAEDKVESVQVYSVASSSSNCLLWPTGRGNFFRNAWVRAN